MDDATHPDPEVSERARGPRRYSAKYKAQILDERGQGVGTPQALGRLIREQAAVGKVRKSPPASWHSTTAQ